MIVGSRRPGLLHGLALAAAAVALMVASTLLPRSFSVGAVPAPQLEASTLPELELSISNRAMAVIGTLRERALERGLLFRTEGDLVPALIYDGTRRQRARVRLKGDFVDHFRTDKWSWRVHIRQGGQVLGMRRFSFQAPNTRRYHWESLFFQHLRDEGVLAPRYEFVRLTVNSVDVGVMALEEHFSKELLEAQGRREGVVVRFDEDEFWRDRDRNDRLLGIGKTGTHRDLSWRDARIRPFRRGAVKKSASLTRQSRLAVGLLRGLQEGTARPSDVMDVETTGRWLAISELWGFWHGLRWHNMRFYLNPFTLKLEPVGFDATDKTPVKGLVVMDRHLVFTRVLLSDPALYDAYRRHLARITEREALGRSLKRLQALAGPMVEQIRPEYPKMKRGFRRHIQRRVKKRFGPEASYPSSARILRKSKTGREAGPIKGEIPYTAAAYAQVVRQDDGEAVLELFTGLKEDVQVTELTVRTLRGEQPLAELTELELPLVLAASYFDEGKRPVRIPLSSELAADPEGIRGRVSVPSDPGGDYTFEAVPYEPVASAPVLPDRGGLADLLEAHPFLRWDGDGFFVPAGDHAVSTPLVVPQRLNTGDAEAVRPRLRIEAGARLVFEPDGMLLTWGALQAVGTEDEPVVFVGAGGAQWRGITVLGEGAEVVLRHVRIENTTHGAWGPWAMTGAVTLYKTEATIENVLFAGTRAEDALNLVRSTFTMRDVEFRDTRSDALDSDFSEGTLERCTFLRLGGDGIDLSGSTVTATDIEIREVHDKALSIGEASQLDARRVVVSGAGVAVVSKDASETTVADIVVSDAQVAAFMSYSKKPVYGPGSLQVEDAQLAEGTTVGVVQRGSTLTVDGEAVPAVDLDVDALYARGVMRR